MLLLCLQVICNKRDVEEGSCLFQFFDRVVKGLYNKRLRKVVLFSAHFGAGNVPHDAVDPLLCTLQPFGDILHGHVRSFFSPDPGFSVTFLCRGGFGDRLYQDLVGFVVLFREGAARGEFVQGGHSLLLLRGLPSQSNT